MKIQFGPITTLVISSKKELRFTATSYLLPSKQKYCLDYFVVAEKLKAF